MRIRSLDSIRFIAAFCVAIFHFNINMRWHLESLIPAESHFGVFVDFFFVLSGFVIGRQYLAIKSVNDYTLFLRRRIARIYPLHILSLMIFALMAFAMIKLKIPINHPETFDFSAFPANLLLTQAWGTVDHISFNGASWSVSAELFVYVMFPLFAVAVTRLGWLTNIVIIITFVVLMAIIRQSYGLGPWTEATFDYGNCRAIPTFYLGVILSKIYITAGHRLRFSWMSVYLLSSLALLSMNNGTPDEVTILLLATVVLAAACAERFDYRTVLTSPIMVMLGDASYAIYMTHGVILLAVSAITRKLEPVTGVWSSHVIGVAALAATPMLSLLVYRRFECPARTYLNELRLTSRRPAT